MIVMDFIEKVKEFGIFSIADIEILYPDIDKRRLFEWKNKGYISKIRNGWYCLPEFLEESYSSWIIANLVHAPSYISLESALDYYGLIPEGVFMTTSVTTNRPLRIEMVEHNYSYSHIKNDLFNGYQLVDSDRYKRKIRVANFEKAIVDFFYFRSNYKSNKEISELRFNEPVIRENLNIDRLFKYIEEFGNMELETRVRKMLKIYTIA
jgi:predicted transcriptional regulator of viral defense system